MRTNANRLPIELTDDLTAQIDNFAAKAGRSSTEVVADAVQQYLSNQDRWQNDMNVALLDTEDGIGYDGDEVLEWMQSWGTNAERPRPQLITVKR